LSRDPEGVAEGQQRWEGRVTSRLKAMVEAGTVPLNSLFYLCGNCDMIYEVYDIISEAGIEPNQIFAEVYF
jgi:ferredoxin--NADP+ reductase/benzoate/toluate 1,2-dioxygenase reductase subunit